MRRILRAAAFLLGLVGLLAAVALLLASTPTGMELCRQAVVTRLQPALRGRIELDRLRLRGWTVEATGLRLYAPSGELVVEVPRAVVSVSPLALLSRRLELTRLRLEGPRLWLAQGPQGCNLALALAPAPPRPASDAGSRSPPGAGARAWTVEVARLELARALLRWRSSAAGGEGRELLVEELQGHGWARCRAGGEEECALALTLTGQGRAPVAAPLALVLRAGRAGGGEPAALRLAGTLGRSTLRGVAVLAGARGTAKLRLEELLLAPELGRALLPGSWPLVAPLRLAGTVAGRPGTLQAALTGQAAGAELTLQAGLDLPGDRPGARLSVTARSIDLAALLGRGPRSALAFALDIEGGGRSVAELEGAVRLRMPPGSLAGEQLGPVRLQARLTGARLVLEELHAALPGATLSGSGSGTSARLRFSLGLRAVALRSAAAALGHLLGAQLPLPDGQGELQLVLGGSLRRPAITLRGHFPRLRYRDCTLRGSSFELRLVDLGQPIDFRRRFGEPGGPGPAMVGAPRLRARVHVAELQRSRLLLRSLEGTLAGELGGEIGLALRLAGPAAAVLQGRLAGRWDLDRRMLTLQAGDLRLSGQRWVLGRPARIRVLPRGLRVEELELRAGQQAVRFGLELAGSRLDLALTLEQVRLAGLPLLALPIPGPAPGGRLDGRLRLEGRLPRPDAALELRWSQGSLGGLAGIELTLVAGSRRGRLAGTLEVSAPALAATARFDLPRRWPVGDRVPLSLELIVERLALSQLGAWGEGELSGRLALSGTGAAPVLLLALRGGPLSWPRLLTVDAWSLELAGRGESPLQARLEVAALGRRHRAALDCGLSLGRLLQRPLPGRGELRSAPLQLQAELKELPLGELPRLVPGLPRFTGGRLDLRLAAAGSMARPRGTLLLELVAATLPGVPQLDGRLKLRLGHGLRLRGTLLRRQSALLSLQGTLAVPDDDLWTPARWLHAPLRLDAELGPLVLQRLSQAASDKGRVRSLRARLQAALSARGTLAEPMLRLEAKVRQIALDAVPVGEARLTAAYARQQAEVGLALTSPGEGRLHLSGSGTVDLSLPALLQQGIPWRTLPVQAELRAQRFDLASFSGLGDSPWTLGGKLDAELRCAGELARPRPRGKVVWRNGRLLLPGLAELRAIELVLELDEHHILLRELHARAGEGRLRLSGEARRLGGGDGYALSGRARVVRFPVPVQGQEGATVSARASFTGEARGGEVQIRDLYLAEASIVLPEPRQKRLQVLSRPGDVVLTAGGQALNTSQRLKLAKLDARWGVQTAADGPRPAGEAADSSRRAAVAGADEHGLLPRAVLRLRGPRNLHIRSRDAEIEVGLSPGFTVELAEVPRVEGTMVVRRGRIEVLGRPFEVSGRSQLRFAGPSVQPVLDLHLVHLNEREQVTLFITAQGPWPALKLTVRSEPPRSEAEIFSLITTGHAARESHAARQPTAGDTAQASTLLSALAASRLKLLLGARMPLDVLAVEAGEGLDSSRIEAGTYVLGRLYVAYVARIGADPTRLENRNAMLLEYRFTPRWSIQADFGDARTGSANVVWTRHY